MRARTAANLSASPSIAIFSLQYPTQPVAQGGLATQELINPTSYWCFVEYFV
jgi:hypothetical protein